MNCQIFAFDEKYIDESCFKPQFLFINTSIAAPCSVAINQKNYKIFYEYTNFRQFLTIKILCYTVQYLTYSYRLFEYFIKYFSI